ncbi:MAG: cytochrome P460 family protein [Spirochaetota bacterium]
MSSNIRAISSLTVLLPVLAAAALMLHCGKKTADTFTLPENYRQWKNPVDRVITYPVPGHGEGARLIFANDKSFDPRIKEGNLYDSIIMQDGSVIIKESYQSKADIGKSDPLVYVMVKDTSVKDAQDGWLYYMKKPNGILQRFKGKMCHECHAAANESHPYFDGNPKANFRDYLFVPFYK